MVQTWLSLLLFKINGWNFLLCLLNTNKKIFFRSCSQSLWAANHTNMAANHPNIAANHQGMVATHPNHTTPSCVGGVLANKKLSDPKLAEASLGVPSQFTGLSRYYTCCTNHFLNHQNFFLFPVFQLIPTTKLIREKITKPILDF